jgi:hypothetical protein
MKRRALIVAAMLAAGLSSAAMDIDDLWNFNDAAASQARFREALASSKGDDALMLRTQIARALGHAQHAGAPRARHRAKALRDGHRR